ncbi:YeeE/YedE family protein [Aurantiacibacter gangjinensis]|nr:YeeE/YedE family protein [Aurantiacibacter gangjinensis]APE29336.1 Gene II and X protein [Aurantiacibacter gangjinensis]
MRAFLSLLSGTIFGFGLALSGMMNPARVRGFLDLFGDWDPTLAFVMGGAMLVMAAAWLVQRRLARPTADRDFHLPETQTIDAPLLSGAVLFGVGWGLAGLCPGPAIASLGTALPQVLVFVVAMIVGMATVRLFQQR